MAKGGIPLGEWSGSDAVRALHETIRAFVESSDRQAKAMISLTRWIAALTVAMLVAVVVQIVVSV